MTQKVPLTDLERIDRTILNSLAALFAEPDFDNDSGEVRFLDQDDRCVWLGLFPTDEEGHSIGDEPIVTWTIEVTHEASRPVFTSVPARNRLVFPSFLRIAVVALSAADVSVRLSFLRRRTVW